MTQKQADHQFGEDHYQLAMEAAGIGLWDWDNVQKHMVWDARCQALFGLQRDEETTTFRRFVSYMHVDDRKRVKRHIVHVLNAGEICSIEYRVVWPDGSVHWVSIRGRGMYDAHGKATRMLGVMWDITPQMYAEEMRRIEAEVAQQQSEALVKQLETEQVFLQTVMEQYPSGLLIADAPSGKLLLSNRAASRMLGDEPFYNEEHAWYAQHRGIHPDGSPYKAEEYPLMRAAAQGEIIEQEDTLYRRVDGSVICVAVSAAPIRDVTGKIIAAVAEFHDVSERHELERKKDEFISIASHELRTPLTTIKGNLQLAERHLKRMIYDQQQNTAASYKIGCEEIIARIERALYQVNIQNRLIKDLLDASRIQTAKLCLAMASHDLVKIVFETVTDVQTVLPERSIRLDLPESKIPVLVDSVRIGQVIHNYLTNAFKYSAPDKPVDVGITLEDGLARVWVKDYGTGLSPEAQEQIWDRFYQVSSMLAPQSLDGGGLGLGLYISRALIQEQGGNVGVTSIPDKGSTFWFTLPLLSETI